MTNTHRLVCCGLILGLTLGVGCGDDEEDDDDDHHRQDAGAGVCDLAACPAPDAGVACCTPRGNCGFDPVGLGLSCFPNEPVGVCELDDCPTPAVGVPCCTPNATCGADPFATGAFCFPNAPPVNFDAAVPPPVVPPPIVYECGLEDCPEPATGVACCAGENVCGSDPWGIGLCFANLPEVDAAIPTLPDLPPVSTEPPDDPSVTGECPSFLGLFGPVWGCCSQLDVCGVFQAGQCLVPIGAELPVPANDDDAGIVTCTPPPAE